MVIPRSRSRSIVSSTCSDISRSGSPPQRWMKRSASVDFPWSMWAMIEKLRMCCIVAYKKGCRSAPFIGSKTLNFSVFQRGMQRSLQNRNERNAGRMNPPGAKALLPRRRLALDRDEQSALAASHVTREGGVALQLREQLVELLDGSHLGGLAPAGDRRDHVARAHVCTPVVADFLDDHPALQLQVALLLGGEIDHGEPEAVGRLLRRLCPALAAARDAVLGQLTDRDGNLPGHALAPHFDACFAAGLGAADDPRQLARSRYWLAVELKNNVARFHSALFGGTAFLDGIDERPCRPRKAERLGKLFGNFLDHDADPPAIHAAELAQLALHIHRNIDRDREGKPHKSPGAAVDLRIDAHDFAPHVEQRPA